MPQTLGLTRCYKTWVYFTFISVHEWDKTTSVFGKWTAAMLDIYFRFRFCPKFNHQRVILHRHTKFHQHYTTLGGVMTLYPFFSKMPGLDYPLCRLYHAWGGPHRQGPRISCQIFNMLFWRLNVWTFNVGLNVTMTTKQSRRLFGGKKCPAGENPGYAYEKRTPPYVGMGPPNG